MTAAAAPVLSVEAVTKHFGSTTALTGVDLTIRAGSVHALVGMNGSGKSTLVKTLSGFHTPDAGRVLVNGQPLDVAGKTRPAMAFVHQDLALVPGMSVVENLALGRPVVTRRGRIDRASEWQRADRALTPFGLEAAADAIVGNLTKAEATIVAIARALEQCAEGCSVLVLDEPTSALPASQTEHLLEVVRGCAARGIGVLFISHRLREVIALSDEVTVLRNGAVSCSLPVARATLPRLVHAMVGDAAGPLDTVVREQQGEAPSEPERRRELPGGEPVLTASALSGVIVDRLDLQVHAGEIVGVAGLLGSGVEELGGLLSAREAPVSGSVRLDGRPAGREARRQIGFVPADRAARGVLPGLSARENTSITHHGRFVARGRINRAAERRSVARWFADLSVHPPEPECEIRALSGGNQQKLLLARWLAVGPRILVAEEPTQGIDVHAKAQILDRLTVDAAAGLAVVLLSGEPEEITPICDRMIVLREGRLASEFVQPFATGEVVAAMHEEGS